MIISLRSLIFLDQQLTRFFYGRYQGVHQFQRFQRVSNQLFYRCFCAIIKTTFIVGIYS